MSRTRKAMKVFTTGDVVEVVREPGHSPRPEQWELATYVKLSDEIGRSYHQVTLHGQPRFIDIATGMECASMDPNAREVRHLFVPSVRIRARKEPVNRGGR